VFARILGDFSRVYSVESCILCDMYSWTWQIMLFSPGHLLHHVVMQTPYWFWCEIHRKIGGEIMTGPPPLFFFFSWMANTQINLWTTWVVSTHNRFRTLETVCVCCFVLFNRYWEIVTVPGFPQGRANVPTKGIANQSNKQLPSLRIFRSKLMN
jgi:hypothetical protein